MSEHMAYKGRLGEVAALVEDGGPCELCRVFTRMAFVTPCCHLLCSECILSDPAACPVPQCWTGYVFQDGSVPVELQEMQPAMEVKDMTTTYESYKSSKMVYLLERLENIPTVSVIENGFREYRRKKVIVFSQFTETLMLCAGMLRHDSEFPEAYAELFYNEMERQTGIRFLEEYFSQQLKAFRNDPEVFILLLGTNRGSVGLDLSFVEHIFLMEPIWDAALEKQVVSRAHRMGAKAPIQVETLVMKGSVEEDMLRMRKMSMADRSKSGVQRLKKEDEHSKRRNLLLRLKFIRYEDGHGRWRGTSAGEPMRERESLLLREYLRRKNSVKASEMKKEEDQKEEDKMLEVRRPRKRERESTGSSSRKVQRSIVFIDLT